MLATIQLVARIHISQYTGSEYYVPTLTSTMQASCRKILFAYSDRFKCIQYACTMYIFVYWTKMHLEFSGGIVLNPTPTYFISIIEIERCYFICYNNQGGLIFSWLVEIWFKSCDCVIHYYYKGSL